METRLARAGALLKNPIIPRVRRLPLHFDPLKLQADLVQVAAEDWQAHFNRAVYEGDWSGAPLRAVPGSHMPLYSDPTAQDGWADTPLLECCAYFREVLARFACPLLSVRLLRLAPGALIKEHRDYGLGLDCGEVRLHVVVSTNPGVECRIDGQDYHWAEGECWYADFGRPHSFANRGATERVHLVLDCRVNDWLLDLLTHSPTLSDNDTMNTVVSPLDLVRQKVHDDPALQARLFEIHDAGEFIAAVSRLAAEFGQPIGEETLRLAMQQGRRDWIERDLP
jgi:hypothetical protein